jgi:hypothetical protein
MNQSNIKFFVHSPGVVNVRVQSEKGAQRTPFMIVRAHGKDKLGFKAWSVLQINSPFVDKAMPAVFAEYATCKQKVIEWLVNNPEEACKEVRLV